MWSEGGRAGEGSDSVGIGGFALFQTQPVLQVAIAEGDYPVGGQDWGDLGFGRVMRGGKWECVAETAYQRVARDSQFAVALHVP